MASTQGHAHPKTTEAKQHKRNTAEKLRAAGKALLAVFGVWLLLAVVFVILHRPLLRSIAHAWVVEGPPFEKVDAILIPGGNIQVRPFAAAKYYHAGKSDRLVTFKVQPSPSEKLGITRPAHVATIEILDSLGVPRENVTLLDGLVSSSKEESDLTVEWCRKNNIDSLAILTDTFPSRRIANLYRRAFQNTGITVHIVALKQIQYTPDNWWTVEDGLISFQNEVIKYLYYRLRY